ncbi:TetR family transcriptional regulator [Saccharothrix sp. NPDC042600]|uniref:TetR/AcrR family transcriptional regulator n=1 Tax=Saccharothrix TaxID=2071 RepID=UPI0033C38588|nr:TetR family transcriptional regulator [Saccharothrix mutabilis subsp. capreolus]
MPRASVETREHVLRVAHDLFYWHGIRATGVDRVAEAAGVAPTTLYRLFADKDELIAAYVERADRETRAWFTAAVRAAGPDPRARILAVFDTLNERVGPDRCRGCTFLMALAEFPDDRLPAHRRAVAAKSWVRARMGELTAQLGVADPEALADQLVLVMEGVHASAQGSRGPADQARALAEAILPPA